MRVEFGEAFYCEACNQTGGHPMASSGLFCLTIVGGGARIRSSVRDGRSPINDYYVVLLDAVRTLIAGAGRYIARANRWALR